MKESSGNVGTCNVLEAALASGRPVLRTQSGELHGALCWEESVLGIMLCFHSVEILNNF